MPRVDMQYIALVISLLYLRNASGAEMAKSSSETSFHPAAVDAVLNNAVTLRQYFQCLMDLRPCTSNNTIAIRQQLPEVIASDCASCSEEVREAVHQVMRFLVLKRPAMWTQLERKYSKYRRPQ